jgi:dihydrolipoamide dehydrogenase
VPEVVFSDPPLASAGLTVDQARAAGAGAVARRFPLGALGRGVISLAGRGWVKVVFDPHGGRVLGLQLAGGAAHELVGAAAIAIEMGATLEDLALTIQAHPTFAESLAEVAEVGLGQPIHIVSEQRSSL